MTDIMIGCPTQNRSWILPKWKEYVDAAIPDGWDARFIFAVPTWDNETTELVSSWENTQIIPTSEPCREDVRPWANKDSYNHMAELRNTILRYVRGHHPDLYLSLDSDILLHPLAVQNMYETMQTYGANAVSSKVFLDQVDWNVTNAAAWVNPVTCQSFMRHLSEGTYPVDVIMAIQMMDNLAYNVNYEYHDMGEDFGWCKNLGRSGASVYFDSRVKSKHVMTQEWLDKVDPRVGY